MEILISKVKNKNQFEEVLEILKKAHEVNKKNGLLYSTAKLDLPELINKATVFEGITFLASVNGKNVGTATVCFRSLNYWYHTGMVATIKLVGVLPEYSGKGIAKNLIQECIREALKNDINVIVSDTAEGNVPMKKTFLSLGFVICDYCKYPGNNFNSDVFVRWLDDFCYDKNIIKKNYLTKKSMILNDDI
ncbi:MAG: GNAT family N-acetyltransferase [Finegoldia magna]|uniref:GNAT family N-acetyltransferase n=1 Tax=Finegoldia magna TaxID=1260 RepID=UPI0029052B43|nr:GNAT family N-acetyltransferase [Finegoldia magna]MDU1010518.1 GNAT family N-acetyltransferase [Finegoldia magna]MDU1087686.1 GNAT family N-acetyltransferase [Finegoldia magna]